METDNRTMVGEGSQTLARGLKLLDLVADGRDGVPVRELAAAMRLPRSIVQRLLYTLEAEGFLERHPSQVGYRLAIKLWGLGCAAVRRLSVRDVARPYLVDLVRKTNETAKIGVLDGSDVVYVDGVDSPQAVRAYVPIGGRAPARSVATGKAILAFLPTEKGVEFEQIRKRGYTVNRGEWEAGVGAIAAPVFDADGAVVASIGIILPLTRLTAAKAAQYGAWSMEAAAEISRKLGHRVADARPKMKRAG